MAYVSLYRKYRPQTFEDVVGQIQVTRTLANAIAEDRLHHAYLFTGPRDTGKTSTARILAKAINCEEGPTATPCNTCRQCQEITDGSSVDVIELDMASHGGVDDARELRDRALFAPASARRKVYILDEVHMASTAAFNALLKLIEEPPEHVMFAMATTDPQKVLPTIMSRVQRLDLRRVSAADVAGNVRRLCEAEGYTIEDAAVEAIVRAGDGSLRDTQSVLEQVLAFTGTQVTAAEVQQVLGQTPTEKVAEVVDRIAARDVAGLLAGVQRLVDDGHDLRRFTLDLVQHVRDLLVLGAAPDHPDLVDATDERRQLLLQQATALPAETLLRAVRVLAETVTEQRLGSPRLPLELALATLVVPSESAQLDELTDRLARLEAGAFPSATPSGPPPAREAAAIAAEAVAPGSDEDASTEAGTSAEPEAAVESDAQPESEAAVESDAQPEPEAAAPADPVPTMLSDERDDHGPGLPAELAAEEATESATAPDTVAESRPESVGATAAETSPGAPAPASAEAPAEVPSPPADEPVVDEPVVDETAADEPAADEPAAAEPAAAETADPDDELALIQQRWDAILEVVREGSRRHHAVFFPATPIRVGRGILTLKYGQRHASFHAANAAGGEYAAAMQKAIQQTCGVRVRLEIIVEGEDDRRRPQPPSLTPDDARTPVLHGDDAASDSPTAASASSSGQPARSSGPAPADEDATASSDEELDVREAESAAPQAADREEVGRLLIDELGAELVDERPASTD